MPESAVGLGFDVHPFATDGELWLGGLLFEGDVGLSGHSDGDVVCHAVADALLGAVALGDIGEHFPETAPETAGIAGDELLTRTLRLLSGRRTRAGVHGHHAPVRSSAHRAQTRTRCASGSPRSRASLSNESR